MRLLGAIGGLEDDELRATFNGGLGMVVVVPAAAADAHRRPGARRGASRPGSSARSCRRRRSAGERYAEAAS